MPPLGSTVRKTSHATTTAAADLDASSSAAPRRTAGGRAIRTNTTRPANYYARPFGSFGAASATANLDNDTNNDPPGFFPAVQFFTDAVTALPKEVVRQFTLIKEVEAKVHGPNQKLGDLVDAAMQLPTPARKSNQAGNQQPHGMINLASHSALGSATASLVNGVAPAALGHQSAQNSISGSVNGEELLHLAENDEDMARRRQFLELRAHAHNMLPNLDEKNVVLAEANRVLNLQLLRIDSVLPHIDNEISEDARLGSMTHWAYPENRRKQAQSGTHSRAVQATNTLANVATAMHEAEISQARREAGKEAAKEKVRGRGKEHLDSDFDDKPKKTHAKIAKNKATGPTGLGISTNGEPVKRRKVDKTATAMERSVSGTGKAAKGAKDTPRSTPASDVNKKAATKAKPGPTKKKVAGSASNSPALVSSPLHNSFNPASIIEPPGSGRPQSSRTRQVSTATNLRHEQLADDDRGAEPAPGATNGNSTKTGTKRKAPADGPQSEEQAKQSTEISMFSKQQDETALDSERPGPPSRSDSNSGKGGRGSKNGTPRADDNAMSRTRSTRSLRPNDGHESSSSEQPQRPVAKHKRVASNSHLVKQLASFNRSPDLDRNGSGEDEELGELVQDKDGNILRQRSETRRPERRPVSRRNTIDAVSSPPPTSEPAAEEEDEPMPDVEPPVPELEQVDANEVEEEEESEHDPDDPNEPRYCYCNRGSYGEMIACDNTKCEREWFHLECTELTDTPGEDETWYCRDCRPQFQRKRGGRGGRRGGG